MAIQLLSENVINKIAAGEVIARPVCVVRELVDNALDAGANAIEVHINFSSDIAISVSDNGNGIHSSDLPLACMRHHTSKITNEEDIFLTTTRGFRGEALAAIAAVSHVRIVSATTASGLGNVVCLEAGQLKSIEKCSAAKGTKVEVSKFFFNTPVREKFLRTMAYEASLVKLEVLAYVLACSNVQFKYFVNTGSRKQGIGEEAKPDTTAKMVFNVPNFFDLRERIISFFPQLSGKGNLIKVDAEWEMFHVRGYISGHKVRHVSRGQQYLFMRNKRLENPVFLRAVREAYKHVLPSKIMPLVFLSVSTTSPLEIDFNVHPAKKTIALQDSQTFYRAIYHPIRSALRKNMESALLLGSEEEVNAANIAADKKSSTAVEDFSGLHRLSQNLLRGEAVSSTEHTSTENSSPRNVFIKGAEDATEAVAASKNTHFAEEVENESIDTDFFKKEQQEEFKGNFLQSSLKDVTNDATEKEAAVNQTFIGNLASDDAKKLVAGENTKGAFATFMAAGRASKVLGQVAKLYIVFTIGDDLFVMDQHAAHERANYDKIWAAVSSGNLQKEAMVMPIVLTSYAETVDKMMLPDVRRCFSMLGFDYEAMGIAEISFSNFPQLLAQRARIRVAKELLLAVDSLVDGAHISDFDSFKEDFLRESVARIACRSSVMSGDELTMLQMKEMVQHVVNNNYQITCPHGRPFVHCISLHELDSFFERSRHIIKK